MRRFVAILLASLLAGSPAFAFAAEKPKLLRSVAPIKTTYFDASGTKHEGNICSAAVINEKKDFWLTAAHCVADMESGKLYDYAYSIDGRTMKVITFDVMRDLAVVQAATSKPALSFRPFPVVHGEEVQFAGYPFGVAEPWYVKGIVSNPGTDFDGRYMILQAAVAPGMSGSSVVDRQGRVVSVIQIGMISQFAPVGAIAGGATYDELLTVRGYFQN